MMSEYMKFKKEFNEKSATAARELMADFYCKVGELQANCKHPITHWIQEVNEDGVGSDYITKRCYNCNSNLDKMKIDTVFAQDILTNFDVLVEKYRENHPEARLPMPHSCWDNLDNCGYCKICGQDMKQ